MAQIKKEKSQETLRSSMINVSKKSESLTNSVRRIEDIVEDIAYDIHTGELTLPNIDKRLQNDLSTNSWMFGLGVAFEPYEASEDVERWSRYFVLETEGKLEQKIIEYDYTEFKYSWYRKPLLEGNYWSEPYFGEASNALIAEYGVPFWLPGKDPDIDDPSGILFGNISLHKLKQLAQFDHSYIAYYYLLSKAGRYIVHPDESIVMSGTSIFQQIWEKEDTVLNTMAIRAVRGESGYVEHTDPVTQENSWVLYKPMKNLDWSLVVVIDKNRLLEHDEMRQYWFLSITLTMLLVISILLQITLYFPLKANQLLALSLIFALILSVGVAALWKAADFFPNQVNTEELKVTSKNILKDFENKHTQATSQLPTNEPPRFVPTGVYLQSVEFEGANNLKITGYVWQKYEKGIHKGIARGFVLPEADAPSIEPAYREAGTPDSPGCTTEIAAERDCDELIGWYIATTLRQEFDYSLYPLDFQQVWLKMWHEDFRRNIVLIPDMDSYPLPSPKFTPGIQNGFVLPGWDISESWFSFSHQSFNTNFGSEIFSGLQGKPELLYNVNIRRKFMDPFVSRIIPVIVIFILLFMSILLCSKRGKTAEWLGFSATNIVMGLSALFFVVGINHTDLRQSLAASKLMYFEYFYFISYVMILYVATSSIFIARQSTENGKDENFLSKLLYWPVLMVVLYGVTFRVFY